MEAPVVFPIPRRRSFSQLSIDSRKEPDEEDWIQVSQVRPIRDGQSAWENDKGFQGSTLQETFQLRMTEMLMKKMELISWTRFTEDIDFTVDPGPILCNYSVPVRSFFHETTPELARPAEEGIIEGSPVEDNDVIESLQEESQPCSSRSLQSPESNLNDPIPRALLGESSSDGDNFLQTDCEPDNDNDESIPSESAANILLTQFEAQTRNISRTDELLAMASMATRPESFLDASPLGTPIPDDEVYTVDGKRIRLRGSAIWAPPRRKFIFDLAESRDTQAMLSLQNNRCAGCGMKFTKIYARRAKVCNYYNKLFCQCCFVGEKACIPARILHQWNFREYPVSDFAFRFLHEHEDHPVYNVTAVNANLFKRIKNLKRFKNLRIKASHTWQFIKLCPDAEREDEFPDYGVLKTMFTSIPRRFFILEEVDVYSMLDFEAIENGNLLDMLAPLVFCGRKHVESCTRCSARSFLCQVCMDSKDLLFSFQLEKVYQCEGCGALSHLKCYKRTKQTWQCGRCDRIRRKRLRQTTPSTSTDHNNSD